MENLSIEMQQKIALKIAIEIDRILSENNIDYILLAGSCLGAVRHYGFIPWDDDIDIGIFHKDYQRVADLLEKKLLDEFKWIDVSLKNYYPRFHGKVTYQGKGYVDIFPLVNVSNISIIRKLQWILRKVTFKFYKAKLRYANHQEMAGMKEKLKVSLVRGLSKMTSKKFILNFKEWNDCLYDGKECDYCINLYSIYSMKKEMIKTQWIYPIKRLDFEGYMLPVLNDTDSYLKNLYGNDYMTPHRFNDSQHNEKFKY